MNEIAIASIPLQQWETPKSPEQSLFTGTVFEELNLPFFILEKMPKRLVTPDNKEEQMLLEIQQISFYLYDLILYLDTHPEEKEAIKLIDQAKLKRKELLNQFAKEFSPLTMDCDGLHTTGSVPWDIPGTETLRTIAPADKPSCCL